MEVLNAGALLDDFEGQKPDKLVGLRFFKRAAELGDKEGAERASDFLWEGFEGQKPDKLEALKFFKMAEQLGSERAADLLRKGV